MSAGRVAVVAEEAAGQDSVSDSLLISISAVANMQNGVGCVEAEAAASGKPDLGITKTAARRRRKDISEPAKRLGDLFESQDATTSLPSSSHKRQSEASDSNGEKDEQIQIVEVVQVVHSFLSLTLPSQHVPAAASLPLAIADGVATLVAPAATQPDMSILLSFIRKQIEDQQARDFILHSRR